MGDRVCDVQSFSSVCFKMRQRSSCKRRRVSKVSKLIKWFILYLYSSFYPRVTKSCKLVILQIKYSLFRNSFKFFVRFVRFIVYQFDINVLSILFRKIIKCCLRSMWFISIFCVLKRSNFYISHLYRILVNFLVKF